MAEWSKVSGEKDWCWVLSPDAGSWLSLPPAVVRLAAISKASPSHTMSM